MGRIVDSTELIEIERLVTDISEADALFDRFGPDCHVAAIQVMELAIGVYFADTPTRASHRNALLDVVLRLWPLIPFAEVEARETARLLVLTRRAGAPVGERDLQIAATALVHGHEVVTRNVKDFAKVPGLVVIDANG